MGKMLMATQSGTVAVTCAVIFWVIDACAVVLRFWSRRTKKQRLLADDWLTIPALFLNAGLATLIIYGVAVHVLGYPTPQPDTPPPTAARMLLERTSWTDVNNNIIISQKIEWIFFVLSIPALGLTKLSILCLYQRIFVISRRDHRDPMNIAIWFMIVIVAMWTIAFCLRYLFACGIHFDIWWTYYEKVDQECGDFLAVMWGLTISDFLCDIIILVLPLPAIWRLTMPTSKKIAVSLTFMLGGFACIASMIRMIWSIWIHFQHFQGDLDLLMTTFLFWNYMEVTVGLLAACLPTLKALVSSSSVDSIIHTLRSKLSLPSLASLVPSSRKSNGRDDSQASKNRDMLPLASARPSESSTNDNLNLYVRSKASATAIPRLNDSELNEEVMRSGIVIEKGWATEGVEKARR